MSLTPPDWLSRHGGKLRQCPDGQTWAVMLDDEPQYELRAIPVAGKFGCVVEQTVNGKRLESNSVYPSGDDALRGGLEDLRKYLGW
jgi:hypothetical protein